MRWKEGHLGDNVFSHILDVLPEFVSSLALIFTCSLKCHPSPSYNISPENLDFLL